MTDPLLNYIILTKKGIGLAIAETEEIREHIILDIQKTIIGPACIYESKKEEHTRYYFQYFKATVFMCVVKKNEQGWFLSNTLYNPPKEITESILQFDKLLYAK